MKIIENKFIYYKYLIIETYIAGLVLKGWEVKSIKSNNIEIKNSFIIFINKELFMVEAQINKINLKNNRNIKLLLKKKELQLIFRKIYKSKYLLVPLSVYINKNIIKTKIAIVFKKNQKKKW